MRVQVLLDAQPAQHLDRVRRHLDAGADAREARRLLVDVHVVPDALEKRGGGEPADAGADDRDVDAALIRS